MTETTVAGFGWERLAAVVARAIPPAEVDGVWLFAPLRRDVREWGTAIVSRVDGDRRRIYTARYVLAIKGKERGKFESAVQEVGSGPIDALERLLHEAHARIDDEHPPVPVTPEAWFPAEARPKAAEATADAERGGTAEGAETGAEPVTGTKAATGTESAEETAGGPPQ